MAEIKTSDDYAGMARQLNMEAIAILQDEKSDAQDIEKSEKMREQAAAYMRRSEALKKLESDFQSTRESVEAKNELEDLELKDIQRRQLEGDKKFETSGSFFKAVVNARKGLHYDGRLIYFGGGDVNSGSFKEHLDQKALVENVGADGGFLVPPEFRTEVLQLAQEQALVRPRATIIRMARRQISLPVLDQTGTTAGVPAWFGGIQAKWTEESAAKEEQSPKWRQATLTAYKLTLYTRTSDELLDDSAIALQDFLMGPRGFPGAIAWQEDWAFMRGNGAGMPLGILDPACGATLAVARDATLPTYNDLTRMLESLYGTGQWQISQSLMAEMLQLSGPTGNASYIWGSAVAGVPGTLLGMPVRFTEFAPRLNNRGDVSLADWSYYLIGDRQATTVDLSMHERFQYDQTAWRAVHRVGGMPWLSTPLTYEDGTTKVSPFVVLGAKTT